MYFWTYRLRNTLLHKCLKSLVSEDRPSSNMKNGPKQCRNLDDSTFTISIDPCECNWALKSCSELYAKSYESLLTHLLPIISILLLTEAICSNIFRCIYLTKEKLFLHFILHLRSLHSILNIFKKQMTLIADVFLNLRTPKNVVRVMSKKTRFSGLFDKLRGKPTETQLKSERQQLYHVYWSLWRQFRLKNSPWVICKILGRFVNPLTADDKYSLLKRGNLLLHFGMKLTKKPKIFSEFFFPFSKFRSNFEHFEKKMTLISVVYLNWRNPKTMVR